MLKSVGIMSVLLGTAGFFTALMLVLLATGAWHIPPDWFAGRGTPPAAGEQVAAAVEQVILQWRLLLLAIGVFQLLHASALAVSALRAMRLDPAGAALLRFTARLGMLFELLKLGPLSMVLFAVWQAIRDFAPGRFPQLPGVDPAAELSAAQFAWLGNWMLAAVGLLLAAGVAKVVFYRFTQNFFNRPATAAMFRTVDPPR
ncbi:MAG: hypothetical protein WEA31_10050 [Pirellulales bacterium]